MMMIEEEITKLREKLNKSIKNNEKYDKIYSYSIQLDKLIATYYIQKLTYTN